MSAVAWGGVLAAVLAADVAVRRWVAPRLHAWLRARRAPYTPDYCRTCDCRLREGQVWEAREGYEADEGSGGGTYMAITYCRRHAPRGAVRA
jgi:hypothetical protein